jgi:hypothetical protein
MLRSTNADGSSEPDPVLARGYLKGNEEKRPSSSMPYSDKRLKMSLYPL